MSLNRDTDGSSIDTGALSAKVRRETLSDGLDVTLASAYDLIRRQRNDLGHPQEIPLITLAGSPRSSLARIARDQSKFITQTDFRRFPLVASLSSLSRTVVGERSKLSNCRELNAENGRLNSAIRQCCDWLT
jgi:hypothetical protein